MEDRISDLGLSSDGDLIIESGDLAISEGDDFLLQSARNRVKSIKKDWFMDNIGADLEEILGMPNSKEVSELGKYKIITSLIFDGLFEEENIYIRPVPVSRSEILYVVMIKSSTGDEPLIMNVTLDLVKGVSIGGM